MTDEEMRAWIDSASYEQLIRKWRFEPAGSPFFQGDMFEHYKRVMTERFKEIGEEGHVRASKKVGWEE